MSPTRCERPALPGQITFLCQRCHGDLEPIAEEYAGDRVWQCLCCTAMWIYTLAGWGQIKNREVLHRVAHSNG